MCREEQELASEAEPCLGQWRQLRVGSIIGKVPGREIPLLHFPLPCSLQGRVEKVLPSHH